MAVGEAAGLNCRVKHSSLGDQDIILYWGKKELGPNWEWEEMALKNREEDTGRGGI